MGVPEDDVQRIHPEQWAALLQQVRGFLSWNTTGLFCSHHGESIFLGCVQLICYKASCVPGVPLYAQCLFIPALNQRYCLWTWNRKKAPRYSPRDTSYREAAQYLSDMPRDLTLAETEMKLLTIIKKSLRMEK